MRLLWNRLIGFLVVFIGISICVNIIGISTSFLGPLFLFGLGVIFFKHVHFSVGLVLIGLALMTLFTHVFHINVGGLIVAVFFLYVGYRLLTGKDMPFKRARDRQREKQGPCGWKQKRKPNETEGKPKPSAEKDWIDEEIEHLREEGDSSASGTRMKPPRFRNSLIGDTHLLSDRFELEDFNAANGIGDVKIDLSKAIIPEGESTIAISGLIGDVDIYIPSDLEVSVAGSIIFGDLEVLGHRQGGFNRQMNVTTKRYEQAARKVKISVSVLIGDVDVRRI
ncbi:MAG TPA: cell wall-active antibiotics response protein LiaF [Bacillales bacterium]|nr:cell wall-active antibiotics response protein LiaF [Bacillales bacterium]